MIRSIQLLIAATVLAGTAAAHDDPATARYLANAGLMVAHGDTKILFDPLFAEDYGQYRLVPPVMRRALMSNAEPWDDIDAVFISHYHDDHFSPVDTLDYLRRHVSVVLYAPEQAVVALREVGKATDVALYERVHPVRLDYGDAPQTIEYRDLLIEAVRIPHAGWPSRRVEVENIAWRVTLRENTTVVHLGDADTRDVHFAPDADFWNERPPHMAFPPYWFFLSADGRRVLDERLRPEHAVGIHVPTSIPHSDLDREPALRGFDLFTQPGETRRIAHRH